MIEFGLSARDIGYPGLIVEAEDLVIIFAGLAMHRCLFGILGQARFIGVDLPR